MCFIPPSSISGFERDTICTTSSTCWVEKLLIRVQGFDASRLYKTPSLVKWTEEPNINALWGRAAIEVSPAQQSCPLPQMSVNTAEHMSGVPPVGRKRMMPTL